MRPLALMHSATAMGMTTTLPSQPMTCASVCCCVELSMTTATMSSM